MSIDVDLDYANPDPDIPFTTITDLITLLRTLTTAEITESLTFYVIGASTPSVDDQDKIWHKLDGSGRPVGTFKYYSGSWRKEYDGNLEEIRIFVGDPATYFESNGVGKVGGSWDGWALLDGQGGRDNYSNLTPIGGQMDNSGITGFSGGVWRTNVTGAAASGGGAATVTLDGTHTYRPATSAISAAHYSADGNTRDATGGIWGRDAGDGTGGPFNLVPADAGNTSPTAISVVQPFRAMAFAKWVGYA